MKIEVLTDTAADPVSLKEAKDHLRVTHDHEDDLIAIRISAAIDIAEAYLRRDIKERQYRLTLNDFPSCVEVPVSPFISLDAIEYDDADDVATALAVSAVEVDEQGARAQLSAVDSWPTTYDKMSAVRITVTAGYTSLPASIKAALLLIIGDQHEHRENTVIGVSATELPQAAKNLLHPYRLYRA